MDDLERHQLSPNEGAILQAIGREGRILTLIKELAYADVESLHSSASVVSRDNEHDGAAALSDAEVLDALHALARRRLLTCSLTVHRVSTTEYIYEWELAEGAHDSVASAQEQRGYSAEENGDVSPPMARVSRHRSDSNDDILRAS